MAESESARFSRLCPKCGRRVVRRVTTCRCGAILPPERESSTVTERTPVEGSGLRTGLTFGLALAITVGFGVYWLTRTVEHPAPVVRDISIPTLNNPPRATASEQPRVATGDLAAPVGTAAAPPADAPAAANESRPALASLEDVVGRAMPAVVLIETPAGKGSGFYVAPDTLLTNAHVVQSNTLVTVKRADGTSVSARVESRAPAYDIAVLKVLTAVPGQVTIPLGRATTLRQGQDLIVIGSPFGVFQNSVTRGIVSAIRRGGIATLIQTDAVINEGNSGGPVLDRSGTAVAITTMSFRESQGLHFAVAIDHARSILDGTAPASETALNNGAAGIGGMTRPEGSEADSARAQGEKDLTTALDEAARAASKFDVDWIRFKSECYGGSIVGTFDREWFALLANGAMPGTVALQCATSAAQFKSNVEKFQDQMRSADEAARRAGVYPGVIREALRSRRLDYQGWSR